jgi:hypothetical protein
LSIEVAPLNHRISGPGNDGHGGFAQKSAAMVVDLSGYLPLSNWLSDLSAAGSLSMSSLSPAFKERSA